MEENTQVAFWKGEFGEKYSSRNTFDYKSWNQWYLDNYGKDKEAMNLDFLSEMNKESKVLEVGSNVGQQLYCLKQGGFQNLFGVELQPNAVAECRQRFSDLNVLVGSGFDLPFKDEYFDMVYTSGVLIHIAPENLPKIMSEVVRCSKEYIWGFEYFSEEVTEIPYRGNTNVLWKANHCQMYLDQFPNLTLVKKQDYPYISKEHMGNIDQMFLLRKNG